MYLYMLPLDLPPPGSGAGGETTATSHDLLLQQHKPALIPTPTHDGGVEHTAAAFDDAGAWLARARAGDIILFPPQSYLLHLVSQFCSPRPPPSSSSSTSPGSNDNNQNDYGAQRAALLAFLRRTPTSAVADRAGTRMIPWSEKAISPAVLFVRRRDGRVVLGLDKPGPELRGSTRGGDWERVVLVNFRKEGPRNVEVRDREEVLKEEREEGDADGEEGDADGEEGDADGEEEAGGSKEVAGSKL
ncbi:hypothetical protein VTG60DRAFT_7383 [Thermothelomyces hinnuleus]